MSRNRSNLRQPQKVNDSGEEESADEFDEIAATSWKNECNQLESSSPPESPEYLDEYLEPDDQLEESETNSLQEPEPLDLAVKPDSTIDKEAVENHRRIYRQLGIHIPESPTKHPLLGYRFVVKLFLATDCSSMYFLKWSANGRELEVDYQGMQEHLSSGCSIFHSRNTLQFTGTLLAHGFERVWSKDVRKPAVHPASILLIYRNPNFVKGHLQKLQKLAQEFEKLDELASAETEETLNPKHAHIARMIQRGDLCSTSYTCRSALQVARCHFQTLLGHQADLGVLKDRNRHDVFNKHIMTQLNVKRGRSSFNNAPVDLAPSKVPFAKFVKPHESVINIGIGQAPDYAGYYGKVELSKVNDFFSEYLPRYGSKITGYKDIVMDATNKSIGFQQNLPIGMNYSDDEDDVLPPLASDLDLDFMPSTSAAAKLKSSGRKVVEDSDLEQAMQELCGGSNLNEEEELPQTSSSTRFKAKPKPRAKAKPTKRQAKTLPSSSSEGEDFQADEEEFKSRKPKNVKFKTRDDDNSYAAEVQTDSEEQVIEETSDAKAKDMPYDEWEEEEEDEDEEEDEKEDEGEGEDEKEDEGEGEEEEEEEDYLDEDDEDYIDKNIQHRNAPEPPKIRRYDLRNSKRNAL
ncbi:uncharacterized protein LOC6530551 [Drosophila yakuba]|uniref:HSF-type DNA-binding domain-containing protein n=1 Tax=Drosophila yakuba TaxID=7245 RepID=B4P8D8_DROYA|nr:uncharacterized protein LOC6530551 [Drosophila yakuba]EDW91178.2 uncharacterized protein Dyak_GE13668 [Drosophila yakuba]